MGWLWFLGMLVPTIGIVQVGRQALADRYTYLPMIGLAVALVWGVAELVARVRAPPLAGCSARPPRSRSSATASPRIAQTRIWRDSETLFRHTLAVSPRASVDALQPRRLAAHAGPLRTKPTAQYRAALEVDPGNAALHFDLGRALHAQGRIAEAIEEYRRAAALDPRDPRTPTSSDSAYELEGRLAEAIEQYRRAVELDPANPKPRERLAAAAPADRRLSAGRVRLASRRRRLQHGAGPTRRSLLRSKRAPGRSRRCRGGPA